VIPILLDDMATLLSARGFGTYDLTSTTNTITIEQMPDAPNTLIALNETTGPADMNAWTLDGAMLPRWELPLLVVTTRGEPDDALSPRYRLEQIAQLLNVLSDVGLGGTIYPGSTTYNKVRMKGSGIFAYPDNYDAKGRRIFTATFIVQKVLSSVP